MAEVTQEEYESMTERLLSAGILDVLDLLDEFAISGELEISGRDQE